MKILVIEDEKALGKVLSLQLQRKGHRVTLEPEGDSGMQAFKDGLGSDPFDLAIIDMTLPGKSGAELCMLVKETMPLTGVILTSGDHNCDWKTCRADAFLRKPFSSTDLDTTLSEALMGSSPPAI